jgi:hypothetical protein
MIQVSKAEGGKITVPFGFYDTEGSDTYGDPPKMSSEFTLDKLLSSA